MATIFFSKKDFNKSKQLMLQAVKLNQKICQRLNNLGTTFRELQEPKEAINIYKRVLEIDANHTKANYNIGLAFYDLRDLNYQKLTSKKLLRSK